MSSPDDAPGPDLFYVYGFSPVCGVLPVLPSAGVEGDVQVEWVVHGGVGAIVSRVPSGSYGEQALEERCKDPRWVCERAGSHNRVLLAVLHEVPVVPCRFGTLFLEPAGVVAQIARLAPRLQQTFGRIGTRAEWAVKAFVDATEKAEADRNPADRTGAAYLKARAAGRAVRRQALDQAASRAAALAEELVGACSELVHLPLRASGSQGPPVLNVACLLEHSGSAAFEERLRELEARERRESLIVTWSGPWPPYSFVGDLSSGEEGRSPSASGDGPTPVEPVP
jgi:hypothetical protein